MEKTSNASSGPATGRTLGAMLGGGVVRRSSAKPAVWGLGTSTVVQQDIIPLHATFNTHTFRPNTTVVFALLMALVDYGSSDESTEEQKKPYEPPKPKSKASTKPAFQKLVDSANPNKIKVNVAPTKSADETGSDEPPSKRLKVEGAGFKNFNSFLPAPKRTTPQLGASRGGMGKGVSLKTGSAPAFSREPVVADETIPEPQPELSLNDGQSGNAPEDDGLDIAGANGNQPSLDILKKKSTIFKPLSVARKPQKKKPPLPRSDKAVTATSGVSASPGMNAAKQPPKISLFSSHDATIDRFTASHDELNGEYEPLLYQPSAESVSATNPDAASDPLDSTTQPAAPAQSEPDSLDTIADSLNLSSSQRRQLLGRNANKSSAQAIKVTNFNTDEEYAANEVLRQNGETVQHKAVRPIQGGGKHSLRQLVTSAVGQSDALDEKFADGSRNRKEGAGRYGW